MSHDSAPAAPPAPTTVERKAPPEIPEELLDPDAVKVVRRLRRSGFLAYGDYGPPLKQAKKTNGQK